MYAPSRDELMRKVAEHLARVHGVDPPTKTVLNYLETRIKVEPAPT